VIVPVEGDGLLEGGVVKYETVGVLALDEEEDSRSSLRAGTWLHHDLNLSLPGVYPFLNVGFLLRGFT